MPRSSDDGRRRRALARAGLVAALSVACATAARAAAPADAPPAAGCRGTVYLTLDTGNMRDAERIADTIRRHRVPATFFLANERTPQGDHALDARWAPYWRRLAGEGHAFGSHTFDHVYFKPARAPAAASATPQFGPQAGRTAEWDDGRVCAEIARVDDRFRQLAGRPLDRIWRAPGGRGPQPLFDAAARCGWRHVGWTDAGFLGDELPSERFPNDRLVARSIARIGDGDVLMAHLGIWSRRDPYAPMLDRLIGGLKAKGLCFATLAAHPQMREAAARPIPGPSASR